MKKSKVIIAVITCIVLIFSFAACAQEKAKKESVTQAVTNESGEVVTKENGEVVTEEVEAQLVTDENGKAITEVVTGTNGKPLTTVVDNKYVNVTQNVTVSQNGNPSANSTSNNTSSNTTKSKNNSSTTTKKGKSAPKAPADVSSLTASDITKSSLKLSWKKVGCSGYQIAISDDGGKTWNYLEKEYNKTSYTAKDLISNTEYIFRVRAYNKNSAGTTASKWKTVKAKTKENTTARKIKITINLPADSNSEDTLIVKIDGKEVKNVKVNLDGGKYTFTTENKYKGEVEISASLKKHGATAIKTDKGECELEIPLAEIPVLIDDEDD